MAGDEQSLLETCNESERKAEISRANKVMAR